MKKEVGEFFGKEPKPPKQTKTAKEPDLFDEDLEMSLFDKLKLKGKGNIKASGVGKAG